MAVLDIHFFKQFLKILFKKKEKFSDISIINHNLKGYGLKSILRKMFEH
jgi:hypothetical protein